MKKSKLGFFFILLVVNLSLTHLFKLKITFEQILTVHVFLFSLWVLTNLIRNKILKNKTATPAFLLFVNFFRIITSLIFLLPFFLTEEKIEKSYIYNFFIFYFIYIFSEFIHKKTQTKISK